VLHLDSYRTNLLRHLAVLLGRPEASLMIAPRVQVATSRKLVLVGDAPHLVVNFPRSTSIIRGELRVERVNKLGRVVSLIAKKKLMVLPHELRAHGITFAPLVRAGTYRVSFARAGGQTTESRDFFVVRNSTTQ